MIASSRQQWLKKRPNKVNIGQANDGSGLERGHSYITLWNIGEPL